MTRTIIVMALIVLGGFILFHRSSAPPPQPAIVQIPTATLPPAHPPVITTTPKPAVSVVVKPALPAHPVASTPVLPPIPQVAVADSVEHNVPAMPVTEPSTRPLDLRDEEDDTPIPDNSPSYQSLAPEYRPIPSYAPSKPSYFYGPARVTGATSLLVSGVPVELFGIKRPSVGDQCGVGIDCAAASEQALQAQLSNGPVSCHLARPSLGVVVFATCLDGQGTDLAGLLIGDGLVFANARETYAYVGAEQVARDLRKGYWSTR